MEGSKVWINQNVKKKNSSSRNQKRSRNSRKEQEININQPKAKQVVSSQAVGAQTQQANIPSLLDSISQITKNIDLVKLRNHISDLNQVFEQVNGMIQQINQFKKPLSPTQAPSYRYPQQPINVMPPTFRHHPQQGTPYHQTRYHPHSVNGPYYPPQ
ncbi:hypothetical protein [Caldalkalibacillus mannanilyticus]|uniref:hypothetical protein n=1 Tax=Caldalkalibacillus mannanilyticus TaxID=1418 RepID=UPI00046998B9|nr:hypothetical protein [Caldalkalibacillus mannanilyticus]